MAVSTPCLICGGAKAETILSFIVPDVYETAIGVSSESYDRRWVRCDDCGFHYSRYSRDPDAMERLYEELYRDNESPWRGASVETIFNRVIALPPDESETLQRVQWLDVALGEIWNDGLLACRGPVKKALDVGGASGVFGWALHQAGWQCAIVDPGSEGRFVEKRFDIVYYEKMFGHGAVNDRFDLITFNYTLEHVIDPETLLVAARNNLTDGGLLYIEVPDALGFRYKKRDDDIFNSTHLWMFDPLSLVRLMGRCGYTPYVIRRQRTVRDHLALAGLFGVI